ncbi:MAG: adenosine kinase [Alphaproteobacteria bacterium]|nr:adenosine kinase [Alphaproteobacteria bacterium]
MSKDNPAAPEQDDAAYDIVGIGNAIVDVLSKTAEDFLKVNKIHKGTMTLIEAEQADELYSKMGPGMEMSGGSAANTVAAFAGMGGRAGYIGKVSNDQLGKVFRHDISAVGVSFDTPPLEDGPSTARCLILITPDAQRTMCTYLGACVWIAPSDLNAEMIKSAKVTYLEGYLFDRDRAKQTFRKACEIASGAGRKVSLTLSDPFCVDRHRDDFLDLINDGVDIVFANEAEIFKLYETEDMNNIIHNLRESCETGVITRSDKGSLIVTPTEVVEVAAEPVAEVVDTTGAGDMYAAGFLYGYTRGKSAAECGRLGSIAAAEIISHVGARPQANLQELLKAKKAV